MAAGARIRSRLRRRSAPPGAGDERSLRRRCGAVMIGLARLGFRWCADPCEEVLFSMSSVAHLSSLVLDSIPVEKKRFGG